MPAAPGDEVVAPAKALRLLGALGAGLDELNRVKLDYAARRRVIAAHRAALIEVASTVSDALIDELVAMTRGPSARSPRNTGGRDLRPWPLRRPMRESGGVRYCST